MASVPATAASGQQETCCQFRRTGSATTSVHGYATRSEPALAAQEATADLTASRALARFGLSCRHAASANRSSSVSAKIVMAGTAEPMGVALSVEGTFPSGRFIWEIVQLIRQAFRCLHHARGGYPESILFDAFGSRPVQARWQPRIRGSEPHGNADAYHLPNDREWCDDLWRYSGSQWPAGANTRDAQGPGGPLPADDRRCNCPAAAGAREPFAYADRVGRRRSFFFSWLPQNRDICSDCPCCF